VTLDEPACWARLETAGHGVLSTPPANPARGLAVEKGQTGAMLAAFSISPLGTGDSVGAAVAAAVRLVRESGLPNETNAMFTNVEGDWDEVMGLIRACMERVGRDAPRVSVVIKLDVRPGHEGALISKVDSVERHLAESDG
jgi:uncharacterized protein (TIGR00106 family)